MFEPINALCDDAWLQFMSAFRYDAHPMGMVMSTIAALGTFYPEQVHMAHKHATALGNAVLGRILRSFQSVLMCTSQPMVALRLVSLKIALHLKHKCEPGLYVGTDPQIRNKQIFRIIGKV